MKIRLKVDIIEEGTQILDESNPEQMDFQVIVGEKMVFMAKELGVDVNTLSEIVGRATKEFCQIALGD